MQLYMNLRYVISKYQITLPHPKLFLELGKELGKGGVAYTPQVTRVDRHQCLLVFCGRQTRAGGGAGHV